MDVDVYVEVDIKVDIDVDAGTSPKFSREMENMRERSFKLSDLSRAKGFRDFKTINSIAADVPGETNVVFPIEQEDFSSDTLASDTNLPSDEDHIDVLVESSKPRQAKPVNKPSVAPGPKLRPKKIAPQPVQQATWQEALEVERPATSHPGKIGGPKSASSPLKRKSLPFGDRYERITTYLEKPLYRRVHNLHQRGEFAKIANLFNAAVREYLDRYYPI
ncbi:hypothetical protein ACFPVX_17350 [Cohnella faecalis]|uniref:Uncharacterized protein n=1 Tax=Cohnella faecalis TaxID=2315694 RepID=A0A398CPZ1_9BACL|nr:hypothetical protein [Cohnella faecalis]RIE01521.1 hypothetical protein D3H35_24525 [Cohnella faecalis]